MGAEPEGAPVSDAAALLVQKTYRGYRARRKLADAAIMSKSVGVGWWNVVNSVVLRENTLYYFAHSKSWKAHDNWKRLKRKASKLGKGLEKDNKALKLALQHWLEAVDARHRYGHNLRPYYLHWLELETNEPFFYWLDLGIGRQVELSKCTRATLQDQQITYLSPEQRRHYEVSIYNGKLFYKLSGELVHTGTAKSDRWIFVMSPHGGLYIGKKVKGVFQHSSFLAGGATTAAGRLIVEHGVLKLMEAHSGHYRPSPENFEALVHILIASGADLHLAKVQLVSDDLVETRKAEKLAQQVREGVQHAGAEAHVEVTVQNQKLVTVDMSSVSADDASSDQYLVTNLTFETTAEKPGEEEEQKEAEPVPDQTNEAPTVPQPRAEDREQVPAAAVEETRPTSTRGGPKKKPCALVLPSVGAMCSVNPNLSKTPSVPTSPGFSRNASLAVLTPQERRHTLKAYGPKKSPLAQTSTKKE